MTTVSVVGANTFPTSGPLKTVSFIIVTSLTNRRSRNCRLQDQSSTSKRLGLLLSFLIIGGLLPLFKRSAFLVTLMAPRQKPLPPGAGDKLLHPRLFCWKWESKTVALGDYDRDIVPAATFVSCGNKSLARCPRFGGFVDDGSDLFLRHHIGQSIATQQHTVTLT